MSPHDLEPSRYSLAFPHQFESTLHGWRILASQVLPESARRKFIAADHWRRLILGSVVLGLLIWLVCQSGVTPIVAAPGGTPLLLAVPHPTESDWPGFRGVSGQGAASVPALPGSNQPSIPAAVWNAQLDCALGAPCVWREQVFLLTIDRSVLGYRLVSYSRTTGNLLWSCELPGTVDSPEAAALTAELLRELSFTPACDGELVFVPTPVDGTLWLSAVSRDGRLHWSRELGPFRHEARYGVSPVLHGPLVILAVDQPAAAWLPWQRRSYIVGVHRQTGDLVWRTLRRNGHSQGIPIVATVCDRPQLLIPDETAVRSYEPDTGQELWSCRWKAPGVRGSVVTDATRVFAIGSEPNSETLCIRGDGWGDVTSTHCLWKQRRLEASDGWLTFAAPWLLHQRRDGAIFAIEGNTGRTVWRLRVAAGADVPAVVSGREFYCLDRAGTLYAFDLERRGAPLLEIALSTGPQAAAIPLQTGWLLQSPRGLARIEGGTTLATQPAAPTRIQ